jgi:hypothetical protein
VLVRGVKITQGAFSFGIHTRKGICESCGASGFVEDEWEDQGLCRTCGDISLLGYGTAKDRGVFRIEG